MAMQESGQLIRKKLAGSCLSSGDVSVLSRRRGNIPLALAQVTAFTHETSVTILQYLQLLGQNDDRLLELRSQPFEETGRDSSIANAVIETWMITFEQIIKQHRDASDLLSHEHFRLGANSHNGILPLRRETLQSRRPSGKGC